MPGQAGKRCPSMPRSLGRRADIDDALRDAVCCTVCKADHILIRGCDGDAGASKCTGFKYAGAAWEFGFAGAHQALATVSLAVFMRSPSWISVLAAIRLFSSIWTEARSYGPLRSLPNSSAISTQDQFEGNLSSIGEDGVHRAPDLYMVVQGQTEQQTLFEQTPDDFTEGRVFYHCARSSLHAPVIAFTCFDVPLDREPLNRVREELRISRGIIVVSLEKSGVIAHQMARKLRSAGFTPQKSELSSHQISIYRNCPHFHAELPSNLSMEQAGR